MSTIRNQIKSRKKKIRKWANEAVNTAAGMRIGDVATKENLLSLCVKLSGKNLEVIRARAQFYSKVDTESLGYYIQSGSREVTAAHIVALLTDLPASWLYPPQCSGHPTSSEQLGAGGGGSSF